MAPKAEVRVGLDYLIFLKQIIEHCSTSKNARYCVLTHSSYPTILEGILQHVLKCNKMFIFFKVVNLLLKSSNDVTKGEIHRHHLSTSATSFNDAKNWETT